MSFILAQKINKNKPSQWSYIKGFVCGAFIYIYNKQHLLWKKKHLNITGLQFYVDIISFF